MEFTLVGPEKNKCLSLIYLFLIMPLMPTKHCPSQLILNDPSAIGASNHMGNEKNVREVYYIFSLFAIILSA